MSLLVGHGVYNTRNMRTEELNALFKRLGINDICAKAGRSNDFKRFFTAQSVGAAESEFRQYLDKFYETRNAATHDLGLFRALGAVDLHRNIDFFKLAIFRVGEVLKQDILSVD